MNNKEIIKEKFLNTVRAVKDRPHGLILLGGTLSLFLVLTLAREDGDFEETSSQTLPFSSSSVQELQEGLPSEKVVKEQIIIERTIPQILDFMVNTDKEQFLISASELRGSYDRGEIYVTDVQKPEETNFTASSGRFPGTWVEWERQQGLKIAAPKTLLNNPNLSDLDLACRLNINLIFTERLEGLSIPLTLEDVGEMVQSAVKETEKSLDCKILLGDFQVKAK